MAQHVKADRGTCQGYGNCVMKSPEYFDLDDDGLVVLHRPGVDPTEEVQTAEIQPDDFQQVKEAVSSCPVSALWIEDDS